MSMIDFEKFIIEAYESGMTPEEFNDNVYAAVNKLKQKAEQETERDARLDLLDSLEATFMGNVKAGKLHYDDAATLLTLVAANDDPNGSEWSRDEINDFYEIARKHLPTMVKSYDSMKRAMKNLRTISEKAVNALGNKNKSDHVQRKVNVSIDKALDDVVNEFLKMFDQE